jgi:hypothetical protein
MTDNTTTETAVDRIPLARSVRYAARGLPEVPNQYGPGVLAPSEITLTYRAASDSQLGRVHAYVAGRIWVDGVETPLLPGGLYGQHYFDGLDGWPEWLAEEARLHDPDAPAVVPSVDRAAVCICGHAEAQHFEDVCITEITGCDCGDYLTPDTAREVIDRLHAAAKGQRAAVLTEAANAVAADTGFHIRYGAAVDYAEHYAALLRRLAGEATPDNTETLRPATIEWTFEACYDIDNDKWHGVGNTYSDHDEARDAFKRRAESDSGRVKHFKFRMVRATTTYTVEDERTPEPVEAAEAGTGVPRCTHRPNYCWGCPGGCAACQCHAADRVRDEEADRG